MPIKNTFYVLESPTGAADVVLNNHVLTITGLQPMDFRRIETFFRQTPVAAANGTLTITPPASPATATYTVVVNQYVRSVGRIVSATISVPSISGGVTSQTNIADSFRAQLRAIGLTKYFNFSLNPDGNTAVVITPIAPDSLVNAVSVGTAAVTFTTGTQTVRQGLGSDLLLEGFTGLTNANYYTRYEFVHTTVDPKGSAGANDSQVQKQTLLVSNGASTTLAGNALALNTQMTTVLQGVDGQASPASIEGIAII